MAACWAAGCGGEAATLEGQAGTPSEAGKATTTGAAASGGPGERAEVAAEKRRAVAALRRELAWPSAASLQGSVGLPAPAQALSLFELLERELMAA